MLRRSAVTALLLCLGCVPWSRVDVGPADAAADREAATDASPDAPPMDLGSDAVDDVSAPPDVVACGAIGQPCCAPRPGEEPAPCLDVRLACLSGTCQPCGAADQACCASGCARADLVCNPVRGCVLAPCAAGLADCDLSAANGCEASVATDPANCGACGTRCGGGTRCVGGSCQCPVGQSLCGATCRDLRADNAHCGACDRACAAGQVCSGGSCTATCAAGTTACGGSCRDLANDPGHCTACGRACAFANGVPGCRAGACFGAACNAGFGDCDGAAANGCETATAADVGNCGACGNRCQFADAAASCAGGRCVMGACAAGFRDCNGNPADGCETNTASGDPANCGGCGARCPPSPVGTTAVCSASACGTSSVSCAADRRDCDGVADNGCEVAALTDVDHCGGCGMRCSAAGGTPGCAGGACSIACSAGLGDCDGAVANGCETSTQTSAANCGGCNRACSLPNATAGCAGGQCTVARCAEGFGDCDGVAANGCERNLRSDGASCGACGVTCGGSRVCSGGVCQLSCGALAVCGGACRDTRVDPDHCGACGRACSAAGLAARTCGAGACNGTCAAGRADCNGDLQADGCETDTNATATACGGCGMACSSSHVTPACAGGVCTGACAAGYADCDGDRRANGCERAVGADVRNCGGCNVACPSRAHATATCAGGACGFTCVAPYADCDGMAANGCETSLNTGSNCGACGTRCGLGLCVPLGVGYICA